MEELIILPRLSHTHADRVFLDKFNSPVSLKQQQIRRWLVYHKHTTDFLFYYTSNWEIRHRYKLSGMLCCVVGQVVPCISKAYGAFTCNGYAVLEERTVTLNCLHSTVTSLHFRICPW